MDYELFNYRFAKEILEHPDHSINLNEIVDAVSSCPLFIYPNKSVKQPDKDVSQILLNAHFDIAFGVSMGYQYQPKATLIPNAGLEADFRNPQPRSISLHLEVQFGNMARWYSDIFKFQSAYSQNLIDVGVCIVPMLNLANRIDSTIAHFERCVRELPSADNSITLPILIIGIYDGPTTITVDASSAQFPDYKSVCLKQNKYRIINGINLGTPIANLSATSAIGTIPQRR